MLGNNEPIKGVDLSEAFGEMVRDLPWKTLKTVVTASSQLHKRCTAGGHRLEPKQRPRVEKVLVKEAEKNEFDSAFTNGIFAAWYPLNEDIHGKLEEYFHSEEYEAVREEREIEEDRYVLPQEKFDEFFAVADLACWRLLLCFSPLEFTEEQAKTILEGKGESQELLDRIQQLEENLEDAERKLGQSDNECAQAKSEADKATSAAQSLRQEKKDLAAEVRQLRSQFETSQAENRKLRTELDEKHRKLHEDTSSVETQRQRDIARLKKELAGHRENLESWQSRYEEQRVMAKQLGEQLAEARRQQKKTDETVRELQATIEEQEHFADLVLNRIDWTGIARQMKLTPALRLQFNNLIRRLDYEEDKTLTIEGQLPDFWNRMVEREQKLVQQIATSNNAEVADGSVEDFWLQLTDEFEDIKISLEARAILLKLLQNIFYQTLEMDDLAKPRIPTGKK